MISTISSGYKSGYGGQFFGGFSRSLMKHMQRYNACKPLKMLISLKMHIIYSSVDIVEVDGSSPFNPTKQKPRNP